MSEVDRVSAQLAAGIARLRFELDRSRELADEAERLSRNKRAAWLNCNPKTS